MGPQNQGFWPKINCSQMKLPNFVSSFGDGSSKIGHDFSNKVVEKLTLEKTSMNECTHYFRVPMYTFIIKYSLIITKQTLHIVSAFVGK